MHALDAEKEIAALTPPQATRARARAYVCGIDFAQAASAAVAQALEIFARTHACNLNAGRASTAMDVLCAIYFMFMLWEAACCLACVCLRLAPFGRKLSPLPAASP